MRGQPPDERRRVRQAQALLRLLDFKWMNKNPQAYLRHVFERIAEHPVNRIAELLPWSVAAQIACDTAESRLAA